MSLDAPNAREIGLPPRVHIAPAEVDDYTGGETCPRCGRQLHTLGTPRVPIEVVADDALAVALQEADEYDLPVFGWHCDRHRVEVVLPAPYDVAPDPYEPVTAVLDELELTLAVPTPSLPIDQ